MDETTRAGGDVDRDLAQRAFAWHMQRARRVEDDDPAAARGEEQHALALAERFGLEREVVEACGTLALRELDEHGAPLTAAYLERGLAYGARWPAAHAQFLWLDGVRHLEQGGLAEADACFRQAAAVAVYPAAAARAHAGLGTIALRDGLFAEACAHFDEGLATLGPVLHDFDAARVELLDGRAEAERVLGDDRSAALTSARVLELTERRPRVAALRRGGLACRARALNALGLLAWRAGQHEDASRRFVAALRVGSEAERARMGETVIALERQRALARGEPPPREGSPGASYALAFVRLSGEALVPLPLEASPPSPASIAQARAWRSGETIERPLQSVLSGLVGRAWWVSRVQDRPAERRLSVELVAAGPLTRAEAR
ncbi:MAG: hypothetical protein IT378_20215 [Sandaracinaceae bacterium]|nr:hypothetical protein [Sandaracinaceae bacterium]